MLPLDLKHKIVVTNQGEVDLLVDDIFVDDAAGPFSIGAITTPLILQANRHICCDFCSETAANNRGFVYIESNDPDTPTAEVELLGQSLQSLM